jgi:hypothetical protein
MQYAELCWGADTAHNMAERARIGSWPIPIEAVVDANAVFTNVTAVDVKLPLEESLIIIVMSVREQFSVGLVQRLWWCATNDMLADGLTKGACARAPLLRALKDGRWQLQAGSKSAKLQRGATPVRATTDTATDDCGVQPE